MDERVRDHARTLVDWSARIEAGDAVVVSVAEGAHDLAVAVAAELAARDADPVFTYASGEVARATLRNRESYTEDPAHELALYEGSDAVLHLGGGRNTAATADVPGDRRRASARATRGVREARLATRWVKTVHPTRSLAQEAGMAYEQYRDFVYGAVLRDWAALRAENARLKAVLDDGSTVRVVNEGTDVSMRIDGRTAVNSSASVVDDSHNLPSGEVFTAPHATEGEVTFGLPTVHSGTRIEDAWLRFEDGEVVAHDAARGAGALADLLDTDDGARRLGELGVGTNRGIDRTTGNLLFDEKMAGTVHLALGRAYDACLPPGEAGTDSAVHVDLITDMRGDSRLEVDGEVVQRNGTFRWEDGFEAGG
jgi:aminopeptidase